MLRVPGYRHEKIQPKITLIQGKLSRNPGRATYRRCTHCRRSSRVTGTHRPFKPKLVAVHHVDPAVSLWFCEGCPHVLIKVDGTESH